MDGWMDGCMYVCMYQLKSDVYKHLGQRYSNSGFYTIPDI